MAKVVLGFGSSHAPQLRIGAENWPSMLQKDANDPRFDYQEVLKNVRPGMDEELTPEVMKLLDESNHRAMGILRDKLEAAAPDAIVVIGDDQHEQYLSDNQPMFSIYHGDALTVRKRMSRDTSLAQAWKKTDWRKTEVATAEADHPAESDLAVHIIESLVDSGFDVASSSALREDIGVGHAFSFLYYKIMPEKNIPSCRSRSTPSTHRTSHRTGAASSWARRSVALSNPGIRPRRLPSWPRVGSRTSSSTRSWTTWRWMPWRAATRRRWPHCLVTA